MLRSDSPVSAPPRLLPPREGLCSVDGHSVYCLPDFDRLDPFLLSVVSDTDLWMYLSSTGALTAGRVNEDGALFPYETDDKLHRAAGTTGPVTVLRVRCPDATPVLWQPLAGVRSAGVRRTLYKSPSRVIFEEFHEALGLLFRARWAASDSFGFVRSCTLENLSTQPVAIDLLDGLLNLLPASVPLSVQQGSSCLVNAFSRSEIDPDTGLALFSLASLITDRAEPAESLRANLAFCCGLPKPRLLLSDRQVEDFRNGRSVHSEHLLTGRRGAFLAVSSIELAPASRRTWHVVADASRDHVQVESLRARLRASTDLSAEIESALAAADDALARNIGSADGLQCSADGVLNAHHFANVLFNNMRGGVFADGYSLSSADFRSFVAQRHKSLADHPFLASLPDRLSSQDLLSHAERGATASSNPNLLRLAFEYLPLTFSRRHGDPSRPWNRFSIHVKNPDGSPALSYQGNWRDIFQNWEAMALSFPDFFEHLIAKFLNASTADGHNPYRLTRDGIDWEVPDPHNPWSHIGYWGDHQIVYLLRLLEASQRHHPGRLGELLARPIFSYADVPYRLKPYDQIVADPWHTITFDFDLHRRIEQRVRTLGSDGRLLPGGSGGVLHVTLLEKLLVPALAKLSNLVLDGGIWMNTQRPEWNDANNALVGAGLSVVTACHLRRYASFCADLFESASAAGLSAAPVSAEIADLLDALSGVLASHVDLLASASVSDAARRSLLDALGAAISRYRAAVYSAGLSAPRPVSCRAAANLLRLSIRYLDHTLRSNRRCDGLYHAYNLLDLTQAGSARLSRLPEMLEGQVAVLSSGALSAENAVELLAALFASPIYRQDQQSFMLYPERTLPSFLEKNRIPADLVESNPLLTRLLADRDPSLLSRDAAGHYRFNASFRNAAELSAALDALAARPELEPLVAAHRAAVLAAYESVFHHHFFTGRSGTMYGYEGIGCIYWHMVAKLLLAVQETFFDALTAGRPAPVVSALADFYYRVRAGLGFNKSAADYGAVPTEPYSHTPRHAGAQQPGMTGQVKEEILTRFGELGVRVDKGTLSFHPALLRRREFLAEPRSFALFARDGSARTLELPARSLAFTLCQLPVVYRLAPAGEDGSGSAPGIRVISRDGRELRFGSLSLDPATSSRIFARDLAIDRVEVFVPRHLITLA